MMATRLVPVCCALGAVFCTMGFPASAQSNEYTGYIERRAFHTWSETPQLSGASRSTTSFTETQVTMVRIERGRVIATYLADYSYDTQSSGSGAYMDGRCPVTSAGLDLEVQDFPEQAIPAQATVRVGADAYTITVGFQDNAVGVRTTRHQRVLSYNRGAKSCPDNPDKYESTAKEHLRPVDRILISDQALTSGTGLTGSLVTPVSTVNSKPGRIESRWETVRWSLNRDGPTCAGMAASKMQYYRNVQAELNRLTKERMEITRNAIAAGSDGKTPKSEVMKMYEQRDALSSQIRDLASKNAASPWFEISDLGRALSPQAFATSGCATKG